MNLTKQKGFTLIELMIVVAIIGILASIAIPQFSTFRVKAFNTAAQADAKNGVTLAEAYYTDAYEYPAGVTTAVQGPNKILMNNGTAGSTGEQTWNISDGVGGSMQQTAVTGYCIQTKHKGGNALFLASDVTSAAIKIGDASGNIKEGVALGAAGGKSATQDCKGATAATITGYDGA